MLIRFQDRVYLNVKNQWYIWESAWDIYRPISGVVWNGTRYEILDSEYCTDPTYEFYGFGTKEMEETCQALSQKFPIENATPTSSFPIGNATWFRDRMACLSPCASKDTASWKRMLFNSKARTCKNLTRNRFTRRKLVLS